MWKLFQYQSCFHLRPSYSYVTNYTHFAKCPAQEASRNLLKKTVQSFRTISNRSYVKSDISASNIFKLCPWKVSIGVSVGTIAKVLSNKYVAECKAIGRLAGREKKIEKSTFDWSRLWKYLWPHRWYLIGAIVAALAVAALNIFIPHMVGIIVNILADLKAGRSNDFLECIKYPALKLVSLYLCQALFTFAYIHLLSEVGEKVAYQMKVDLFKSIMDQDVSFFDVERTGELINRLTVDVQDFKSSFKATISNGLRAFSQIVGSVLSLLVISPQLTGLTILCIPSVVIGGTFIGSLLRKLSRDAQDQMERATSVADEAISNIRTVKAFAAEEAEVDLFDVECEKAGVLARELGLGVGLFQAGTNLFLNCMVLSTLFMGGHLMSSGQLKPGDVMAFLINSQTIQRSMAQLSLLFGSLVKGISAGSRVFEYINLKPTMPRLKGDIIKYHELKGDIEFYDVMFSYPTRKQPILKNFNLRIPAGKTVAIVGSSGNGKSTIAALLERFYDVDGGSITIDGNDIRQLDVKWLRGRTLGFINQEPILFATTIMENIRYGKPDATDEQVYKAAQLAYADDFIRSFPNGYDTIVGERGISLSGGQKQRIAIARALIKEPPILILDEATSALDTESEHMVQQALDDASKGRTVLVIAHRLSTVRNADLIVVLQRGQIAEIGTHDSLKKLKGIYWNLIHEQERDTHQEEEK